MATADAFDSQPQSFERTVLLQRFCGVVRTGGGKAALIRAQYRGDYPLIDLNQGKEGKTK
jgi:hypothetical protein